MRPLDNKLLTTRKSHLSTSSGNPNGETLQKRQPHGRTHSRQHNSRCHVDPARGLETRPVSKVTNIGLTTLGLLFVGLALNAVCLILTIRNYERSPIFGILGSILYFPAVVADQASQFSSLPPPPAITYVEALEALVAIGIIILGALGLQERAKGSMSK